MSAPDTNVEKQKENHKAALFGIKGVVIFAAALLIGLVIWLAYQGQDPVDPETKIDGRTGQAVETD